MCFVLLSLIIFGRFIAFHRCHTLQLQQYKIYQIQSTSLSSLSDTYCPANWITSSPKVREDLPTFPSYRSYNCQPIKVSYDNRSLRLNNQPVLFLSGSMHPARATMSTWERALDEAVTNGLNMITMYVFWSMHQSSGSSLSMNWTFAHSDASSPWDLASAIRAVASRGMFVHFRPGKTHVLYKEINFHATMKVLNSGIFHY